MRIRFKPDDRPGWVGALNAMEHCAAKVSNWQESVWPLPEWIIRIRFKIRQVQPHRILPVFVAWPPAKPEETVCVTETSVCHLRVDAAEQIRELESQGRLQSFDFRSEDRRVGKGGVSTGK